MPRTRSKAKLQAQKQQKKEDTSQEPQPQPKPAKKNLKKQKAIQNIEQRDRIWRSKYERIYLINATRQQQQEKWQFKVQGTTGKQYHVKISIQAIKCTCVDFRIKKKPCKHIFFIVTQVGQNQQLLDFFSGKLQIPKKAYKLLDNQLYERLKARLEKSNSSEQKEIDLKDDTNCVICFCEMDKQTENLEDCFTCKKYFHSQCLSAWKNHNPTCPLCRGALLNTQKDPLNKLNQIDI